MEPIGLGRFTSLSGRRYLGVYCPDNKTFDVAGPIGDHVGAAQSGAFKGEAVNEEDARRQIEEAIKKGLLE